MYITDKAYLPFKDLQITSTTEACQSDLA